MKNLTLDWEKRLNRELNSARFAREFIQGCIAEDISIQLILGKVIRAEGLKAFSERTGIPCSNILRTINPKHNPTLDSINRLLEPFSLELSLRPKRKKRAA